MDAQSRWLWDLVTFCRDEWHYVDSRICRDSCNLLFNKILIWLVEVAWQQGYKHISKSIIRATVSMCRSQCIAVSGVKGRGRKILEFLI